MSAPSISVVTPFLNGLDLLPDYEAATIGARLVLIDNGSEQETAAALAELPPERGLVIRNETNLGFAAANNQGYARADGDIIVFLNSDIAADPAWLKLVADDVKDGALYGPALQRQLVYGLWIPYIEGWCIAATRATWERLIPDAYKLPTVSIPSVWTESDMDHIKVELTTAFSGKETMIVQHRATEFIQLQPAGPWDASAYPGPYWEDNDLCFRALQSDIELIQTTWPVQHKGGRSAGPLVKHGATFEDNRATFAARVRPVWERMQK